MRPEGAAPAAAGEFELKLGVPADQVDTLHAAFVAHGAQLQQLQAVYFDTADGLLARHAMALRLRLEPGGWVQTLKTAGDGIVHRQEHEVAVAGLPHALPALDTSLHAHTEAGRLLAAALAAEPGAALRERLATAVTRLRVVLHTAGGSAVEAVLDVGEVRAAGRSSPVLEVELEHLGGPRQGVFDIAVDWVRHGGLWVSTLTKAERGERLLRGRAAAGRVGAAAPPEASSTPDGHEYTWPAALLQSLRPLLAHAGDLAEGDGDAQTSSQVRQLRQALRRLQDVLHALAPSAPDRVGGWRAALAVTEAALRQRRGGDHARAAVRARELQTTLVQLLAWAHADPAAPGSPAQGTSAAPARTGRHRAAGHR